MTETVLVDFDVRSAAAFADGVVHFRVSDETEPVQWSVHPLCKTALNREYVVDTVQSVWREASRDVEPKLRLLRPASQVRLPRGQEYIAYVIWEPRVSRYVILGQLLFPVRDGRIVSPRAGELNGVPIQEAVARLRRWAAERSFKPDDNGIRN